MRTKNDTSRFRLFLNANYAFGGMLIVWLLLLFLFTTGEIILNGTMHEFPQNAFSVTLWSLLFTTVFWLKWIFIEYLIFIPIYMLNRKTAKIIFFIFFSLLAVIHLGLLQYFNTALIPLGADVYGYSIADIEQTVNAAGGISTMPIVIMIATVIIIVIALNYGANKLNPFLKITFSLPIISALMLLIGTDTFFESKKFDSEFDENLALHKSDFFYTSSYDYLFPELYELDIYADSYIGDYGGDDIETLEFEFIDEIKYPFLHKNTSPDVLKPFLKKSTKKPSIVIILVEGLGRAFTNQGAYLGNFTPFLDSLSQKSLYWKNFLSEGGRTFAVLPSLMGSLPFGNNGFLAMGEKMPNHLTLYNLLKHNGYQTSFYYGGESKFDNMKLFLQRNNVDQIIDYDTFPTEATKLPSNKSGFSWGYSDKAVFKHYLNTSDPYSKKPQLNVLLTVAMHNPFLIEEQEKYNQRVVERMDELNFEDARKKSQLKYTNQFASVLYTDDALKAFFESYKKRADYENTIFLITGDHRMPEIPMTTKIDRYHVPLILYSPLLTKTKTINSVSTHFDIAPSLISYLENNHNIKVPSLVSWMGSGLDTVQFFRNIHSYPLLQTKTDLTDFILGKYHINSDKVFELKQDMNEEINEDPDVLNRLENTFHLFRTKNSRINGESNNIIPDSIYKEYSLP